MLNTQLKIQPKYPLFKATICSVNGKRYRYGFNGQEKDDEINVERVSYTFKYRIHDARLGKFLSVDPLASKYPWNSSFAFAENSPIAFIDLEGLERYYAASGVFIGKFGNDNTIRIVSKGEVLNAMYAFAFPSEVEEDYFTKILLEKSHEVFTKTDDAADAWGQKYNRESIKDNKEYGSTIYELLIDGVTYVNYTEPEIGDEGSVDPSPAPTGKKSLADIHSHGAYKKGYDNNVFSAKDKKDNKKNKTTGYLTTPDGSLKKYNPVNNLTTTLNRKQPSDSKDPKRKNEID